MNTSRIDFLNTFLILLSFGLSYLMPFELFLFAYAVLGPIHYFTEMNWIRDKNYFVQNKTWIYIITLFSLLLSFPMLLRLSFFDNIENAIIHKIKFILPPYLNSLFLIALIIALSLVTIKHKKYQYIIISIGVILAIMLNTFSIYNMLIGVLLPTIIHVYFFTILFMWYGNLKTKNTIGYLNLIFMILIPIVILLAPINKGIYYASESIQSTYLENGLDIINSTISKLLKLPNDRHLFFYEVANLKIQMFIAFSYTYHYLNWFSKTTVIGWHKKLTEKKSIFILMLWVASVGLYFYDYKLGLAILLFCSILHVFMEFPLNVISIKEIGKKLFKA